MIFTLLPGKIKDGEKNFQALHEKRSKIVNKINKDVAEISIIYSEKKVESISLLGPVFAAISELERLILENQSHPKFNSKPMIKAYESYAQAISLVNFNQVQQNECQKAKENLENKILEMRDESKREINECIRNQLVELVNGIKDISGNLNICYEKLTKSKKNVLNFKSDFSDFCSDNEIKFSEFKNPVFKKRIIRNKSKQTPNVYPVFKLEHFPTFIAEVTEDYEDTSGLFMNPSKGMRLYVYDHMLHESVIVSDKYMIKKVLIPKKFVRIVGDRICFRKSTKSFYAILRCIKSEDEKKLVEISDIDGKSEIVEIKDIVKI